MTDLPVWLQEIRDRAEAATPGPWRVVAHGEQDCLARREITAGKHIMIARVDCVPGVAADFDRDYAFIAHARTDVPRLLELVGEMGEALRLAGGALDEACDVMHGGHHPGQLLDKAFYASVAVDSALAKYRGEVENNG